MAIGPAPASATPEQTAAAEQTGMVDAPDQQVARLRLHKLKWVDAVGYARAVAQISQRLAP